MIDEIDDLLKKRDACAKELRDIDAKLRALREKINKRLGNPYSPPPQVIPVPCPYPLPVYPLVPRPYWVNPYGGTTWTTNNTSVSEIPITIAGRADA